MRKLGRKTLAKGLHHLVSLRTRTFWNWLSNRKRVIEGLGEKYSNFAVDERIDRTDVNQSGFFITFGEHCIVWDVSLKHTINGNPRSFPSLHPVDSGVSAWLIWRPGPTCLWRHSFHGECHTKLNLVKIPLVSSYELQPILLHKSMWVVPLPCRPLNKAIISLDENKIDTCQLT